MHQRCYSAAHQRRQLQCGTCLVIEVGFQEIDWHDSLRHRWLVHILMVQEESSVTLFVGCILLQICTKIMTKVIT